MAAATDIHAAAHTTATHTAFPVAPTAALLAAVIDRPHAVTLTVRRITLHCRTLPHIDLPDMSLYYFAVQFIELQCLALHCLALPCLT